MRKLSRARRGRKIQLDRKENSETVASEGKRPAEIMTKTVAGPKFYIQGAICQYSSVFTNFPNITKYFLIILLANFCAAETSRIYGVDLELLKIRPALPPSSFQYELQVDYSKSGNVVDFGVVSLRTVASNHELIFPELVNRNPFSLKAESQGVVCFRLYQTNRVLLEDCWQIRDLSTVTSSANSFYNSETFTKTKADGTMLTYKITQYLINDNQIIPQSANSVEQFPTEVIQQGLDDTKTAPQTGQTICPLCTCSSACVAPIIFAVLEGILLFIICLMVIYYRHCRKNRANNGTSGKTIFRRPMINASNNGKNKNNNKICAGDSKIDKKFCWQNNIDNNGQKMPTNENDETKRLNNGGIVYSTVMGNSSTQSTGSTTSSSGSVSDDYYDRANNVVDDSNFFDFFTGFAQKIWPPKIGRRLRNVWLNVKRNSHSEPPEPPPPDYRNESFDVDDTQERVYDCIDEKHLDKIVYKK